MSASWFLRLLKTIVVNGRRTARSAEAAAGTDGGRKQGVRRGLREDWWWVGHVWPISVRSGIKEADLMEIESRGEIYRHSKNEQRAAECDEKLLLGI